MIRLFGCSFQLIEVTMNFLKFEIITELRYEIPENMIISEVTIRLPSYKTINYHKLFKIYPNLVDSIKEIEFYRKKYPENTDLDDILFEMFHGNDSEEIISIQ